MPRLELDWRLTHEDKHTVVEATRALANEVGRGDIGRLKIDDWVLDGPDAWPGGALCNYHHMGATRMADDPRRGVVDRDQRVHSMANLYIAGSSVFPTSGSANPTLTIVAMTLRLAEIMQQSGTQATAP
jgi:choline dehydrogenase-like flavoprotein